MNLGKWTTLEKLVKQLKENDNSYEQNIWKIAIQINKNELPEAREVVNKSLQLIDS